MFPVRWVQRRPAPQLLAPLASARWGWHCWPANSWNTGRHSGKLLVVTQKRQRVLEPVEVTLVKLTPDARIQLRALGVELTDHFGHVHPENVPTGAGMLCCGSVRE
jgi:hypothetical protein